jgi:hypothetical protein
MEEFLIASRFCKFNEVFLLVAS